MASYLRSTVILILGNAKGKIAAFPAQILGSPIQRAVVSRFGWHVREPARLPSSTFFNRLQLRLDLLR